MSNETESKAVTVSVRIYGHLLAIYPAKFRREFGPAMKQVFRDQCRDAWGQSRGWGLAGVWVRLLPDLARTSVVEHFSHLRQKESLIMMAIHSIRSNPRLRSAFVRVFAGVFIGALVCAASVAMWSPRNYSGITRIEVQPERPEAALARSPANDDATGADPYFWITQVKIIESYSVLTNVIAELGLQKKLPDQLGKPQWTIDETFNYLVKMIDVKRTPMTGLLDITVRNPDPQLAAVIANKIAGVYRDIRLELWKERAFSGIEAHRTNLQATEHLLLERQNQLDGLRRQLGISQMDPRDALTRIDYLQYSNILFKLNQIPRNRLGVELQTDLRYLETPELAEKSTRLMTAKDIMASIASDYGPENPRYKAAEKLLQRVQQDYNDYLDGIINAVKDRVEQDSSLLQIIEQKETQISADKNKLDEALMVYNRLLDDVDALKHTTREAAEDLNQRLTTAGQTPPSGMVIVRDPARPEFHSAKSNSRVFLMWMLAGTALALAAGGAAAWIAARLPRVAQ